MGLVGATKTDDRGRIEGKLLGYIGLMGLIGLMSPIGHMGFYDSGEPLHVSESADEQHAVFRTIITLGEAMGILAGVLSDLLAGAQDIMA